jgi:hypothetical protein
LAKAVAEEGHEDEQSYDQIKVWLRVLTGKNMSKREGSLRNKREEKSSEGQRKGKKYGKERKRGGRKTI